MSEVVSPDAASLRRGAHTPEELAWWQGERRKWRVRVMLSSGAGFGFMVGLVSMLRDGELAAFALDRAYVAALAVKLGAWTLSGYLASGTFSWWMAESGIRDAQIRRRRIREALLAPPDEGG